MRSCVHERDAGNALTLEISTICWLMVTGKRQASLAFFCSIEITSMVITRQAIQPSTHMVTYMETEQSQGTSVSPALTYMKTKQSQGCLFSPVRRQPALAAPAAMPWTPALPCPAPTSSGWALPRTASRTAPNLALSACTPSSVHR
jgi:hypothetical protein